MFLKPILTYGPLIFSNSVRPYGNKCKVLQHDMLKYITNFHCMCGISGQSESFGTLLEYIAGLKGKYPGSNNILVIELT